MRQHSRTARFALACSAAAGPPVGSIELTESEIIKDGVRDRQATPAGPGVLRETQGNLQALGRGTRISCYPEELYQCFESVCACVR
jgi:hypothetical protein